MRDLAKENRRFRNNSCIYFNFKIRLKTGGTKKKFCDVNCKFRPMETQIILIKSHAFLLDQIILHQTKMSAQCPSNVECTIYTLGKVEFDHWKNILIRRFGPKNWIRNLLCLLTWNLGQFSRTALVQSNTWYKKFLLLILENWPQNRDNFLKSFNDREKESGREVDREREQQIIYKIEIDTHLFCEVKQAN